ncbi:SDR family NAD(P)-dependent oxidoreductase [Deltaproteobacteria bacterium TL4]
MNYTNLVEALEQSAKTTKGLTFIEALDREVYLSYADLYQKARKILGSLQAQGFKAGDELVFQYEHNESIVCTLWACFMGKIVPIPLVYSDKHEYPLKFFKVWSILNNPRLIVDGTHILEAFKECSDKYIHLDLWSQVENRIISFDEALKHETPGTIEKIEADDLAFLQFSSGSTGDPKGVMLTHKNLLTNAIDALTRVEVKQEDIYLGWMPLSHDFGMIGFHLTPLVGRVQQYLLEPSLFVRNALSWISKAHEHRATVMSSPNFGYRHFLKSFKPEQAQGWDLSCIRAILNGAEPISAELCHEFEKMLKPYGFLETSIKTGYGLAEGTLIVSMNYNRRFESYWLDRNQLGMGQTVRPVASSDPNVVHVVDVGPSLDHYQIRISDEAGNLLKEDTVGIIEIHGDSVTKGYYNNPQKTKEVFSADGWLNTGDLGYIHQGLLVITGRLKDIFFVNGVNYYPNDIEQLVQELPEVELNKVVVCGSFDPQKQRDALLVFLYSKEPLEDFISLAEKVEVHLLKRLGLAIDEVIPTNVIFKTSSGKLQRSRLIDAYKSGKFKEVLQQLKSLRKPEINWSQFFKSNHRESMIALLAKEAERFLERPIRALEYGLVEQGFDSMKAVRFQMRLSQMFQTELPASLVFDYPTLPKLADYLLKEIFGHKRPQRELSNTTLKHEATEGIAVIGIACRFPGESDSPEAFWNLLIQGRNAVGDIPPSRWNVDHYFQESRESPGKMYTRKGSFLKAIDGFDNEVFGIASKEALGMDPQQRLLLEGCWEALENAGQDLRALQDCPVGVFIGISNSDYAQLWHQSSQQSKMDAYSLTGSLLSVAAGRIAYCLGFQGPAMALDTACSSSLVAVHQAVHSLRSGESELALAGGVNLILKPQSFIGLSRLQALSPDGKCKTFDDTADGYGRGEGCGVVVLKRLSDALRDGDRILSVIKGSAVNHDGRSSGLTVPNGVAQERVVRAALKNASLQPEDIDYIEAHGTGTPLGDPQEIGALTHVFGERPSDQPPLWIGSVKTNIGHLESAAGIAGMIKIILSMNYEVIPCHLNFEKPNSRIPWSKIPIKVTKELVEWPRTSRPRRAGVSSFGFSGTNAHLILEEAPFCETSAEMPKHPWHLLCLSAKSKAGLDDLSQKYLNYLSNSLPYDIRDVAYTAHVGRAHWEHRLAVLECSTRKIKEQLLAYTQGTASKNVVTGTASKSSLNIGFLFTGQGSQYPGMGKALYDCYPVFREMLEQCNQLLEPYLEHSLLSVLYPEEKYPDEHTKPLIHETAYTQPCLFAFEYALAQLWKSWGVEPSIVTGHSIGEYTAACIAGVFSLKDGLKLIAARGRFMQSLPKNGAMAALRTNAEQVSQAIRPYKNRVSIAAYNGPANVVISGEQDAIDAIIAELKTQKVLCQKLQVSHAFHSSLMDPLMSDFTRVATEIQYGVPHIPLISNVTGKVIGEEIRAPGYWAKHIRESVQFETGMQTLRQQACRLFLEIGPKPVLIGMGKLCLPDLDALWLPSLLPNTELETLLKTLGELYVQGAPIQWQNYYNHPTYRRVSLPTYPWQRQSYMLEATEVQRGSYSEISATSVHARKQIHPILGHKLASPAQETIFVSKLNGEHYFFKDHRAMGQCILPASGYPDPLLAGAKVGLKQEQVGLQNLSIKKPFLLNTETEIQYIFSPNENNQCQFQVFTSPLKNNSDEERKWTLNVTGEAYIASREKRPPALKLQDLKRQCPNVFVNLYPRLYEIGLHYGPLFQSMKSVQIGQGCGLGLVELPVELQADSQEYLLHPVLLDVSWHVTGAVMMTETPGVSYLPSGLKRVHLYQQPENKVWSYVRLVRSEDETSEQISFDTWIFLEDGTLASYIEGFTLQEVQLELLQNRETSPQDWLYQIEWQPQPLPATHELSKIGSLESWLILADEAGLGKQQAAFLRAQGKRCVLVSMGNAYQQIDPDHYRVNPLEPHDFEVLLSEAFGHNLLSCQGIIHLWSLNTSVPQVDQDSLEFMQQAGCASTLHLVQALGTRKWEHPLRWWFVTQETQRLEPSLAPLQVHQALLWGMVRSLSLEYPEWTCALIDLDQPYAPTTAHTLFGELCDFQQETQVAWSSGKRYVAQLKPYQEPATQETASLTIDSDASYWVTGGLGGIGRHITDWLIAQGARSLILSGRREMDKVQQQHLEDLEHQGVQITFIQSDVSDQDSVAGVLNHIQANLAPLRGIIHAAGTLDNAMLHRMSWEQFTKVQSSKLWGSWNLHKMTLSIPLDFMVFFSSNTAVLGFPGQANYTSANAFMDCLAHERQRQGLCALSINWGVWESKSRLRDASQRDQARLKELGFGLIPVAQGVKIFGQLLKQDRCQVVATPMEWGKYTHQFEQVPAFLRTLTEEHLLSESFSKADNNSEFLRKLEKSSPQERYEILYAFLEIQVGKVLGQPETLEIPPDRGFFDMGMDSLMSQELRRNLQNALSVKLSSTLAFEYPNMEELTLYLLEALIPEDSREEEVLAKRLNPSENTAHLSSTQAREGSQPSALDLELAKLEALLKC